MWITLFLTFLFAILVGLVIGLIIYARWHYGELEALGIPVVKPFLFFGSNYNEPYIHNYEEDIRRQEKYGLVYGVYDGRRPQIFISDPKLIRQICTVDFDHFQNHDGNAFNMSSDQSEVLDNILDILCDEKWRTVRSALTPIFTGSKIKLASATARDISKDYAEFLETQMKKDRLSKLNFKKFAAPMILETLAKCFGGIEIPDAKDETNVFIMQIKIAIFDELPPNSWKSLLPKIFPFLGQCLFPPVVNPGFDYMLKFLESILDARGKSFSNGPTDALQTLVEMKKKISSDPEYKRLQITDNVILAQAWEYFWASYTGVRDMLDLLMYELASNEEIQQKVYQEILNSVKKSAEKSVQAKSELTYLSACIMEVTRMYPGFLRPECVCNKDWEHDGLRISKGMQIMFPTNAIHYNPEFYPNPWKFQPERFLGTNKETRDPYTYMTFGQGPRACIGYRFALEIIKVLAVEFLRKFRFERRQDSNYNPIMGGTFIVSYDPIYLDAVRR